MATYKWYAVTYTPLRSGTKKLVYIQASSKQQAGETYPGSTVIGGPYATLAAAKKGSPATSGAHGTAPAAGGTAVTSDKASSGFFTSIGGQLASGLETGFIAVIKDLWTVIAPWVAIGAGLIIALAACAIFFKGQIGGIGSLMGLVGSVA